MASGPKLAVGLAALVLLTAVAPGSAGHRTQPGQLAPSRRARTTTGPRSREAQTLSAARTTADLFISQLVHGQYSSQWSELAPLAQAQWPGPEARAEMLQAKFSGAASIRAVQIGSPRPGASWVSREDPQQRGSGLISVPISVEFESPSQLQPVGVQSLYQTQQLLISVNFPPVTHYDRRPPVAQVVGEGPASLDAPVVNPANPVPQSAAVPILMYHVINTFPVRSQWSTRYAYLLEYGLTVTPTQFAQQMGYLVSQSCHAISLNRLSDFLLYGLPLPSHPVVLTFDDGRASAYTNAAPVLLKDGLTGTFFVPTALVGRSVRNAAGLNPQQYLSWPQITQMSQEGLWIEDHALYDNAALWGRPAAELQALAGTTAATLEQHTGVPVQYIAYSGPWPYPTAAQAGPAQQRLFSQLGSLGYVAGVIDARTNSAQQSTALIWQMARIRMNPNQALGFLGSWVG